uniref:Protein kinase domain-containing protein n=1 Tax=Macrostomum lignano TaxID=282301 RepID=A0A1I8FL85_9PLAT
MSRNCRAARSRSKRCYPSWRRDELEQYRLVLTRDFTTSDEESEERARPRTAARPRAALGRDQLARCRRDGSARSSRPPPDLGVPDFRPTSRNGPARQRLQLRRALAAAPEGSNLEPKVPPEVSNLGLEAEAVLCLEQEVSTKMPKEAVDPEPEAALLPEILPEAKAEAPRTRLKMYAEKQEVVDYIDLLAAAGLAPRAQNSKAQQRSRDDGQAIDLADKDRDNFGRQRSEGDGERRRENVDNAESDDEVEEEDKQRPIKPSRSLKARRPVVADSTDDDAGSSRGVRRQPRRHRIRTQFPRPAPDLLAAVPASATRTSTPASAGTCAPPPASTASTGPGGRSGTATATCSSTSSERATARCINSTQTGSTAATSALFQTEPVRVAKIQTPLVSATLVVEKGKKKFDSEKKPRNSRRNEEAAAAAAAGGRRGDIKRKGDAKLRKLEREAPPTDEI